MHLMRAAIYYPFYCPSSISKKTTHFINSFRHLTLTNSHLIHQKKIAFPLKQSSNNLAHIANWSVYLHYMHIFHCNNFEEFLCVVTVVNCLS